MHFMLYSCLVILVNGLLHATAIPSEPPAPGYGVEQISWSIEISEGQYLTLNGTAQEVATQAQQINPEWSPRPRDAGRQYSRDFSSPANLVCGNWPTANCLNIGQGINYLASIAGEPQMGPGPGNCGRVSCSYNSGMNSVSL